MARSRLRLLGPTLITLAFAAIVLLVIFPLVAEPLTRSGWIPQSWQSWLVPIESLQTTSMIVFVCGWFFFLGGCFASFLNVVAWRVPRGRTINGSSHCPHCGVRLSMRDNLPIIGWIRNFGRCRNCQVPISPRYLIVEVILGSVTLGLVALEVFGGGWNLPGLPLVPFRVIQRVVIEPGELWFQLVGWHLMLIYALFTMAVIRHERLRVPAVVIFFAGLFLLVSLAIWPELQLIDWRGATTWEQPVVVLDVCLTALLGGLVGLAGGAVLDRLPSFAAIPQLQASEVDALALVQLSTPDQSQSSDHPVDVEMPTPSPATPEEANPSWGAETTPAQEAVGESDRQHDAATESSDPPIDPAPTEKNDEVASCEDMDSLPPTEPDPADREAWASLEKEAPLPAESTAVPGTTPETPVPFQPTRPVIGVAEGPAALALVGIVLGWQATLMIGFLVAVSGRLTSHCRCREAATLSLLTVIWTTIWLAGWRWFWLTLTAPL